MNFSGKQILVTGASGFVGSYFTQHVGAENVVSFPDSIDLTNFEMTHQFVAKQNFDAVLHLAARSSVAESFSNSDLTRQVNVQGTRHLLQSLEALNFSGPVLLVSSGEVYGAVSADCLPVVESAPLAPRNPYAESKVAMENLVLPGGGFSQTPFRSTIVRPFNHIGPGQGEHFAVGSFVRQVALRKLGLETGPMKTGDLDVTRDFTDVRDIVAAYALLLEREWPLESGPRTTEVYNLGSGVETSLRTVLKTLIEICGTSIEIQVDPSRLRAVEQRRMCANVTKVQSVISWRTQYTLRQTLDDCLSGALAKLKTSERISL